MVRNALKRTLIINAGGFVEKSRYEIAKLIKSSLESHSIQSIQFMPIMFTLLLSLRHPSQL